MGQMRSILVLRALQLGDLLCAVPAFRALRASFPRADIVLAGMPSARQFVRRFRAYLDGFIEFPGHPFLPERAYANGGMQRFLARTRKAGFSLALQMHGDGRITNHLLALTGAGSLAGFYPRRDRCPDEKRFMAYPETGHEILRCVQLMRFLGIPSRGTHLEFPIGRAEQRECDAACAPEGLIPGRYAVVHPGGRAPARRWPPEKFAAVADTVASLGLRIAVTGSEEETGIAGMMREKMKTRSTDLSGKLSLGAMAAVIASSRLLISNDTAVSHIAAATRTPSVVVMTASSPGRWAPRDRNLHTTVCVRTGCRPCSYAQCPYPEQACSVSLSAETVIQAARRTLSGAS